MIGSEPSSGSLTAHVKRAAPKIPDLVTFSFSGNIDGITAGLGKPKILPKLLFPPEWRQEWDLKTLEVIAHDISQHYGDIMAQINNDEDEIWTAIAFLIGKDKTKPRRRRRGVMKREVPAPGGRDYREELIKLIENSRQYIQHAINERNTPLRRLFQIKHLQNIASPHTPNAYVTFWRENQNQLQSPAEAQPLPEDENLLGKNRNGKDITTQIGLPKPMDNVASLPEGWKEFDIDKLILMANNISSTFPTIRREVMDDMNRIEQATSALWRNSNTRVHATKGTLKTYHLPVKGSSAEAYRKQLIGMIELCWTDLQEAVWQRNGSLRSLGALQVSPDKVGNAEPTNIYVTHWKESHGLPATPASGTAREISSGASNVQPSTKKRPAQPEVPRGSGSKRSREPPRKPARNDHNVDVGTDSDKEIKNALREDVPSSGSLNPSTPGKGQGHLDTSTGIQHADGSPAHKSDLPATPSTASSTAAGSHSPPAPVEPA
ncbi:hypothetical protein H0H93_009286, partial [Arthromyces matolae]